MRIIAGYLKNKSISTGQIDRHITRPVQALVRKSLFSMIDDVEYMQILDLFCGSGVLGIESISRGADKVIFVDKDRKNIALLKENLEKLDISEKTEAYAADFRMALKALKKRELKFDLIFVDPPYKWVEKFNTLNYIVESDILKTKGRIVHNMDKKTEVIHDDLEIIKQGHFGKTRFVILRRKSDGSDISGNI